MDQVGGLGSAGNFRKTFPAHLIARHEQILNQGVLCLSLRIHQQFNTLALFLTSI